MNNNNNDKDEFLRKLRWQTGTKEFENMCIFQIDCFLYLFDEPLTFEQQNKFVNFIGNAESLDSKTPVDFCIYFIENNIGFRLEYKYIKELGLIMNFKSKKCIAEVNKVLKGLKNEE